MADTSTSPPASTIDSSKAVAIVEPTEQPIVDDDKDEFPDLNEVRARLRAYFAYYVPSYTDADINPMLAKYGQSHESLNQMWKRFEKRWGPEPVSYKTGSYHECVPVNDKPQIIPVESEEPFPPYLHGDWEEIMTNKLNASGAEGFGKRPQYGLRDRDALYPGFASSFKYASSYGARGGMYGSHHIINSGGLEKIKSVEQLRMIAGDALLNDLLAQELVDEALARRMTDRDLIRDLQKALKQSVEAAVKAGADADISNRTKGLLRQAHEEKKAEEAEQRQMRKEQKEARKAAKVAAGEAITAEDEVEDEAEAAASGKDDGKEVISEEWLNKTDIKNIAHEDLLEQIDFFQRENEALRAELEAASVSNKIAEEALIAIAFKDNEVSSLRELLSVLHKGEMSEEDQAEAKEAVNKFQEAAALVATGDEGAAQLAAEKYREAADIFAKKEMGASEVAAAKYREAALIAESKHSDAVQQGEGGPNNMLTKKSQYKNAVESLGSAPQGARNLQHALQSYQEPGQGGKSGDAVANLVAGGGGGGGGNAFSQQVIQKLRDENTTLKDQSKELTTQLDDLLERDKRAQSQGSANKGLVDKVKKLEHDLTARSKRTEYQMAPVKDELEQIKDKLAHTEAVLKSTVRALSNANATSADLSQKASAMQDAKIILLEERARLEGERDSLKTNVANLTGQLNGTRGQLQAVSAKSQAANDSFDATKKEVDALRQQQREYGSILSKYHDEIEKYKAGTATGGDSKLAAAILDHALVATGSKDSEIASLTELLQCHHDVYHGHDQEYVSQIELLIHESDVLKDQVKHCEWLNYIHSEEGRAATNNEAVAAGGTTATTTTTTSDITADVSEEGAGGSWDGEGQQPEGARFKATGAFGA